MRRCSCIMLQVFIAVIITLLIAVPATFVLTSNYRRQQAEAKIGSAEEKARAIIDEALTTAETKKREALLEVKEESIRTQNEIEKADAEILVKNGCFCVTEGANMPSTPEAIAIFQGAKILYSPGKASNAGGVATSGLEMTQNSMRLKWTAEEVDQRLRTIMADIHAACLKYGTEPDNIGPDGKPYINYVKGANIAGFMKVANAMVEQGLV